ncbi:MAG: 50S ribosomal protein L11 [Patescibacteria group bacterium]|nr:50S ribosomal protein L11 [Patescibacteria group bacterium]
MAKEIKAVVKMQLQAGQANPAPPVGTALGPHGVNMQEFCSQFNDKTKDMRGDVVPVVITIYADRSFDFILKTSPAAELLKKAAKIKSGSGTPNTKKVGTVTKAQIKEIAEIKMPDLNAKDIEGAMRIIEGTAKQMGLEVK